MKHQKKIIYKNTPNGDIIAPASEAKQAIKQNKLIVIGRGKNAYLVIQK